VPDDEQRLAQARSFGPAATVYEQARPPYPQQAVDWLVPAGARRVLDVGAGTGKLSRLLVGDARHVMALDPSFRMCREGRRAAPGVPFVVGTAESVPLADASVDVVVVAQAWHWVDPARALPEAARVLRPGGRLGLVWNDRDERVDWVRELGRIMHGPTDDSSDESTPLLGAPFGPTSTLTVDWAHRTDPSSLVALVASRSYFLTASAQAQTRTLDAVRSLLDTHPDLRGRSTFALPYRTRCVRVELPHHG